MALAAAALCLGMVAPGAAANGSVPHFLMRTVSARSWRAPGIGFAAALELARRTREGGARVLRA